MTDRPARENRIVTEGFDTVEVVLPTSEQVRLDITSWEYASATMTPEQAWELGNILHAMARRAGYRAMRGAGS